MAKFGAVPPEVPIQRSLNVCAPLFAAAVRATLAELEGGRAEWPFETLRTEERQVFLYGFGPGRLYDDGRGKVTNAKSALFSWHGFGLAVDVVEKDATPWDAPMSFWQELGEAAERHGLTWGGRWFSPDWPHLQWGLCPVSPLDADRFVFRAEGKEAIWSRYKAV